MMSRGVGSSPRVRSDPHVMDDDVTRSGIISACAERSVRHILARSIPWDHLRVCGAVDYIDLGIELPVGSSPRVRSGQMPLMKFSALSRIISACAERSTPTSSPSVAATDHLRVCGAVIVVRPRDEEQTGSSPRVRSGLRRRAVRGVLRRIISACAERSALGGLPLRLGTDHLRVCGAVRACIWSCLIELGSSPRVRSGPTERVG